MGSGWLDDIARECRDELALGNFDALRISMLADRWGVRVVKVSEDPFVLTQFDQISRDRGKQIEGLTFRTDDGPVVVVDDRLPAVRLRSVGAHELAHVILEHLDHPRTCELSLEGARTKDPVERDANDLGARLLVTGDSVRIAASMGWTIDRVARQFDVSTTMARWRWNTSGAARMASNRSGSLLARKP